MSVPHWGLSNLEHLACHIVSCEWFRVGNAGNHIGLPAGNTRQAATRLTRCARRIGTARRRLARSSIKGLGDLRSRLAILPEDGCNDNLCARALSPPDHVNDSQLREGAFLAPAFISRKGRVAGPVGMASTHLYMVASAADTVAADTQHFTACQHQTPP